MYQDETHAEVGKQLGQDAAEQVARRAENYSAYEHRRIALRNYPRIMALRLESRYLSERENQLKERLGRAEPPASQTNRRGTQLYYWAVAGILIIAAFFFSLIALDPFRLGWIGNLYCLGIAVITPFAVEEFLRAWKSEQLFKVIVTLVFITALTGGGLLAAIRGELLAQQVDQSASPAAVIEGENAPAPPAENAFYESTRKSLQLLMLFLAIAIDLGAGVALHRALPAGARSGEDYDKLSKELADVRRQLVAVVYETAALINAPDIFVARFWRDFYRSMLTQVARKALTKWFGVFLVTFYLGSCRISAQTSVNRAVAIDLSISESDTGRDGVSQFDKNVKGVERLLGSVEAGSRITVIGITENSFSDPNILLRADISPDPGYFGERLAAARQQLIRAWHNRALHLAPNALGTDILGAIRFSTEFFRLGAPGSKNVLIFYSDMRHATRELNLEVPLMVPLDSTFATVEQRKLLTDLKGVTVYVLGANADGRQIPEWESVRKFWALFFQKAGATLGGYSMLLDPPKLGK